VLFLGTLPQPHLLANFYTRPPWYSRFRLPRMRDSSWKTISGQSTTLIFLRVYEVNIVNNISQALMWSYWNQMWLLLLVGWARGSQPDELEVDYISDPSVRPNPERLCTKI